ncbi:CD1107 family mobile element protein [Streptococcus anginosus]|uniref:CD1107 family mobile element protein n=1 Tax=Streptococcus anginosus TaxID=1328 RepID=UPI00319D96BE
MKTSLKKNNKFWTVALAVIVSISCILGLWTVVYAQEQKSEAPTKNEAVQTEVEVNVRYIFEDEKVFKEEKIKAEKGQLLDSGDLPMLPDEMKFIDDFLFYEVKADGKDEIIRKVEKIDVKDKETQTENESSKSEQGTQSNASKTENKGTQTELSKDDISKIEKEAKELQDKLDKLNCELKDKDKLSDKQKEKIKALEDEIESLKEKLKKEKDNKDLSSDIKKEMDKLNEKIKDLEKKANEVNKALASSNVVTPIPPNSSIKTSAGNFQPLVNTGKGSEPKTSFGNTTKDENTKQSKDKEKEIRYPNKLTAKTPANNNSQDSAMDGTSKSVNTNKGVASAPSKARGSLTENKDNANKEYPIHHSDDKDNKETDKYSADARQFITFQTKNGKTFYLIINHDEDSENVMLLTEVSEDDLLNMVEKKEAPKQEVVKEEPVKEEVKPEKKDEKSNLGTYIILLLVVGGALGAGYYFKVVKKKEDKELEALEEEDDDFFSEAESEEEASEVDEVEDDETEE